MEDSFKNWIISLVVVGIVSATLKMFTEGGKNRKTVEKCAGIVLSLVIIAPIPAILGKAKNWQQSLEYIYSEDVNYNAYTENYLEKILSDEIEENLREAGFDRATAEIDGSINQYALDVKYVIIKLNDEVLDDENAHIHNREKAIEAVMKVMEIEKSRIVVYE